MRLISFAMAILLLSDLFAQQSTYKLSAEIEDLLKKDESSIKYYEAAWSYSFIGEDLKADQLIGFQNETKLPGLSGNEKEASLQQSKDILARFRPIPAEQYILTRAKETRLVIINEAHHSARHRVFVTNLLPFLHKLGYNFLGIETLSYDDPLLQQRNYPVLNTGFYSKEPCFGNLIRAAMLENYKLFPYETKTSGDGAEREIEQAENIKKMMDENPNAKFLIYCGYGHALEDSTNSSLFLAMAGHLKKSTGVNPLTIDQVELTGKQQSDNVFREAINLDYSAIFIDNYGNAFNKAANKAGYDANIYHPDTRYLNGRADWRQSNEKAVVDIIPKIEIEFPCLVLAYKKDEPVEKAVPIDVIELQNRMDNKKLILVPNQKYTIVIKNIKGQQEIVEL